MTGREARENTREALARWSLPAPDHLGYVVEPDASAFDALRSPDDVMRRCHAIMATTAVLDGADPGFVDGVLREHGLDAWLAADERACIDAAGDDRELAVAISWRTEALWALLWSLGAVEHLDPTRLRTSEEEVAAYTALVPEMRVELTRTPEALRPDDELLAAADLYYCLHWNEVSARLQRAVEWPEAIHPVAVVERRHALEWLTVRDAWDDVDLST